MPAPPPPPKPPAAPRRVVPAPAAPVVGMVLVTVAITTVWPTDSPEVICVRSESAEPTVTVTGVSLPAWSTFTNEAVPVVCTALVGTDSTPTTWLTTTTTVADMPSRSEGCEPVICTVTGNVATPELTVAMTPTEITVAGRPLVEPAAVTTAFCPTVTSLTTLSLTVLVTSNEPGVSRMNWAADADADAAAADDGEPLVVLPTERLTWATSPAVGAVRVASATASCAVVTACCAWARPALSWATADACEAPAVVLSALLRAVRSDATLADAWSADC